MGSILIKNGFVVDVINKENSKVQDIYIENDRITLVKENINKDADILIDAKGKVVMPGFINTHNHSAMTIFRGYADDLELMDWLNNYIWPAENMLKADDVYYGSYLACIEMLRSGTTTFNDMYFFSDKTIKAAKETKIRAAIGRCIMEVEKEDDERIKEAIDIIEKYKDKKVNIYPNIAPHSPYTCNEKAIKKCVEISKKYNVPLHIHMAETKSEALIIKEKYNMTPTEFLEKMGVFDCKTILAHCVWTDESDIKILSKYSNVSVSHNPVSNCKLASGIANISDLLKSGINVSLGTDGAGSTNSLDMFEEMRLCAYLQKVSTMKANIIDAYKIIQMATINGAKALGLEKDIGSIEKGKKADIIIIDFENPKFYPINNVYSNLVYISNGNDVTHTIVDGNLIMENRRFLDNNVDKVVKKCIDISNKILKK